MVALRIICEHIQAHGRVLNVEIDQVVRNAARNASCGYRHELMNQQEESKRKEKEDANKEISEQIFALTTRRKRSWLQERAENLLDRGEKEDNMFHIRKTNSYRQTIKDVHRGCAW